MKSRIYLLIFVGLLACIWMFAFIYGGIQNEDVEVRIGKTAGLSRVDALCKALSLPEGFQFVERDVKGNNLTYDVGYYFRAKNSFDTVWKFFSDSLQVQGWKYDETNSYPDQLYISYRQGKQLIFVSKIGGANADYVIRCEEEH